MRQSLLGRALEEDLALTGTGHEANPVRCRCGTHRRDRGVRQRQVDTTVGPVTVKRSYYICPQCGGGIFPLDRLLGLGTGHQSERVEEGLCWLGVQMPSAQAATGYGLLTGVAVSAKTVERRTERYGAQLAAEDKAMAAHISTAAHQLPVADHALGPSAGIAAVGGQDASAAVGSGDAIGQDSRGTPGHRQCTRLPTEASPPPAVSRVPPAGLSDWQQDGGRRLQESDRGTVQAGRHVLVGAGP